MALGKRDEATLLRIQNKVEEALEGYVGKPVDDKHLESIRHAVGGILAAFTAQGFLPIVDRREYGNFVLERFEASHIDPERYPGHVQIRAIWREEG